MMKARERFALSFSEAFPKAIRYDYATIERAYAGRCFQKSDAGLPSLPPMGWEQAPPLAPFKDILDAQA
jgi:hypothetical protein